jgi:hypothetical protein
MGGQGEGGLLRAKAPESQVRVLEFQSLGVLVHDVSKVNNSHNKTKTGTTPKPIEIPQKSLRENFKRIVTFLLKCSNFTSR